MKRYVLFAVMFTTVAFSFAFCNVANGQLVQVNLPNGAVIYRDDTVFPVRFWTQTLGQVPSADWDATVQQRINLHPGPAWRVPSFAELQYVYNIRNAGPQLGIRNGLFEYYETNNVQVLANAYGNGIQTPQPRRGIGMNWYIATFP